MNIEWSKQLVESLASSGVRQFVVCAGARNSPLVAVLSAAPEAFEVVSFFEERSAAFFAMGNARRTGRPVAVITTSGTAAAELLPATVEAFHTGVPLILVTADRPRRLRGTGAPQAIDQTGLYRNFVGAEYDLAEGELFDLSSWNQRAPLHLNICFDEPLIDAPLPSLGDWSLAGSDSGTGVEPCTGSGAGAESVFVDFRGRSLFVATASAEWAQLRLRKFLRGPGALLVLVGSLETERERRAVENFLLDLRAPVYLEATSGLRESPKLEWCRLISGDAILPWSLRNAGVARVLRIGSVPTARVWRDLDDASKPVETLSLSPLPFSGLSRGEFVCCEIESALVDFKFSESERESSPQIRPLLEKDRDVAAKLESLFISEPQSEAGLVRRLAQKMMRSESIERVYLGNSLPIREWDLAAPRERKLVVEANRGVNGIDGQLSTFLGLSGADGIACAILGDLTALYDLQGFWALQWLPQLGAKVFVINNGGGKIFSRIFGQALFENRHDLSFRAWADLWRIGYQRWSSVSDEFELHLGSSASEVIEVVPDNDATQRFWKQYDGFWK